MGLLKDKNNHERVLHYLDILSKRIKNIRRKISTPQLIICATYITSCTRAILNASRSSDIERSQLYGKNRDLLFDTIMDIEKQFPDEKKIKVLVKRVVELKQTPVTFVSKLAV